MTRSLSSESAGCSTWILILQSFILHLYSQFTRKSRQISLIMVDAEAGSAVLNSTQAMSEGNGGYNAVGDGSGEQIDSSDEYDPAQDVQDFSFPAPQNQASSVESSNNASRPSSAIPQQLSTQGLESHAVSDATHRQHLHQDSMKLPTMVDTIINGANSTALPVPSATGILKARLPHDTLGILEDRIKEDEKGDLDTWLNLIAEYKRRNKLDDVRKIYDRFFTIFPQAVSAQFYVYGLH